MDNENRKIEEQLSVLDQAIQHFPEYVVHGTPLIYDRDLPVRGILIKHNEIQKRIEISPHREVFVLIIYASQDSEDGGGSWVKKLSEFKTLPKDFKKQFRLLNSAWSELSKISQKDLTNDKKIFCNKFPGSGL